MCSKQLVYLGLSASALLAACGTGDSVRLGSVHVKSQQIDAKTGGLIAVEAADGAPRLVGTKIQIPADALSASTKITIGISAADVVDQDSEAAGPVVDFGPDGTHFATPVRITLPYEGAADVDLFRVFVVQSNGDRQVLLPEDVEYDAAAKTVTFSIDHFTRFQPGRGRHPCAHVQCPNNMCRRGHCTGGACSNPNSCGPRPASPSWICENGSTGGYTGRCLADAMGQCSWEVNNCPRACEPMECGPRPARPNITCADGTTIAGPGDCRRRADGTCSWDIITCPVACQADSDCPPNQACNNGVCGGITMGCRADSDCAQGSSCQNGQCVPPTMVQCDMNRPCPSGQSCQNGQCVRSGNQCDANHSCAMGETCQNGVCVPSNVQCDPNRPCPMGTSCQNGQCVPSTPVCQADSDCRSGQVCLAGLCVVNSGCGNGATCPMGQVCIQNQCTTPAQCDPNRPCPMGTSCQNGQCVSTTPSCRADSDCRPGQACVNGQCTATMNSCSDPAACGPRPAIGTWMCQDGSVGGFTGRCIPVNDPATPCGWEITNCPQACTMTECGPAPGVPSMTCPDGTVAGPSACYRHADGTCGYDITQCQTTPCRTANDCTSSQICQNNVCTAIPPRQCMTDSNCASNQVCQNGVCR